jgi:hypothetical protein
MEDRQQFLAKRIRWSMLLIMRGLARSDTRNAERMKRAHRYREELENMGVDVENIGLFSQEDLTRMQNWSAQSPFG